MTNITTIGLDIAKLAVSDAGTGTAIARQLPAAPVPFPRQNADT